MELRVLLSVVVLGLSACGGGAEKAAAVFSHAQKAAKTAPAFKKAATVAEQTAGMVQAASPARSEPIAELKFELRSRPTAGQTLSVDLALLPQLDAASATVELSGSDGLAVTATDNSISFTAVVRSSVYRKSVLVTPATDGVYFLNAVATLKSEDYTGVRSFTIRFKFTVTPVNNA